MDEPIADKLKQFLLKNGFSKKTSVEVKYNRDINNPHQPEVEIYIKGIRYE